MISLAGANNTVNNYQLADFTMAEQLPSKKPQLRIIIPEEEDNVGIHQSQPLEHTQIRPIGVQPPPSFPEESRPRQQLEIGSINLQNSLTFFAGQLSNRETEPPSPSPTSSHLAKIVILVTLVAAAALLMSFYHCAIPIFSACRAQKTTLSPLIVSRSFKQSNCFLLRYTTTTVSDNGASQSRTRTNTSLYLCVKAVSQEGNLVMVGYDKKISEEDLSLNPPNISYYDTSVGLESCLFANNNQTSPADQDFSGDESINVSPEDENGLFNASGLDSLNITQGNDTINSSNVEDALNKLTMFRVSVFRNGTIDKIEFNTLNDNMTIANIPKYVKLFFPSLDLSLYYPSQSRLLQEANLTQVDIGMELYSFEQTGSGVTLTNQQIIPPDENEQVNSNQQKSSTSVFDSDNNLVSSDMSGTAELEGRQEEPSSEYQVFNFNLSLVLDQNVSMQVGFTYDNLTSDIIGKFQSYFIAKVVQSNNSLSLSEAELKQYLLNPSPDTNQTNSTRLLLAPDGSLQLYQNRRQFNLLKTNLLGIPIIVTGIIEILINIYDLGNYKKQPRFISRAFLRITLGPFKQNYIFFQIDQRMEPLSLSFTLEKIEGIMNLVKGGFIGKLKKLANLPSLFKFDSNFFPNLMNLGSLVNNVYSTATGTQNQLLPLNQVQTILDGITNIKEAIESQGTSLIAAKTAIINEMVSAIDTYYNSTYVTNLNTFNQVRSQLTSNKLDANALVSSLQGDAKNLTAPYIANISGMINGELQSLFQKQLGNLQPFYQMFSYVKQNVNQFEENITLLAQGLEQNFTGTLVQFLEEYYREPMETFQYILQFTEGLEDVVMKGYQLAADDVNEAVRSADELLLGQLNSIRSMAGYSNISDLIALSKETINLIKDATSGIANTLKFANSQNVMIYKLYTHCFTSTYASSSDELMTIHYDLQAQFYILQDIEIMANSLLSFLQKISEKASSNHSIPTKFSQVANLFYQTDGLQGTFNASLAKYQNILGTLTRLNTVLVSDFSCSVDLCFEIDYPTQLACDYDGDEAYYYRDRVMPVRNNLTSTINKINQMLAALQVLNNLSGLEAYKQKIREFSSINYTKLTDYSSLITSAQGFANESKLLFSVARSHYDNITAARDSAMQQFIVGNPVRSVVANSFEALKNWTEKTCEANHTSKGAIDQLRGQFKRLSGQIADYRNNLFNNAVLRINNTLGLLSQNLFYEYHPLELCNISITDQILNIEEFINDTVNFETAQQTILKLLVNITQSQNFVHSIANSLGALSASVNKLGNAYDFINFITNSTELVYLVRNYTSVFGAQIIAIKQQLMLLKGFTTMDLNRTITILQEFIDFPSNLNALTILNDFQTLLNKTSGFMARINFNVLGTMLIIRESVAALENNSLIIAQGCQKVVQDTSGLVAAFLDLTDLVSQDYLIQIQQQFQKLNYDIQQWIVSPTQKTMKSLNQTIATLNITQNSYKLMVAKVKKQLLWYQLEANKLINEVDSKYKFIVNSSLGFISTLKIGYMNELVLLGKDVSDFYKIFVSEFGKNVLSVSSLGKTILKDIYKVKGTASVIDLVKEKIQTAFDQSLRNIATSIDSRLKVISADAEVYTNLLSSSAYNKISTLKEDISINFGSIWSGFGSELERIRSFEQSLTSGLVNQLDKLSSIRNTLEGLEDSINGKIGIIKDNFKGILAQFSRIEKLIFGVLSNTIQDQVINKFNAISDTVDAIFQQDLKRLQNLTSANLPSQLQSITELIQTTIESYQQFKLMKNQMKSTLQAQIRSALSFLNDELIKKFSILKDAQALIRSLPPMNPNQGTMVLFRKTLAHEVLPVFQLFILVITPIGPFLITISVNFFYGCDLSVGLSNFRDIYIQVRFSTGLELQFTFAFDLGIIRFGSYFVGQIMSVGVRVGFRLKGIIPVTLIQKIVALPEIKEQNSLTIEPYLYTQINALSFEVGGFISYLWFKLIWLRIRICFRIRFGFFKIRFCFSIRIPIIIPYFKTNRFGYRFNGVQLAQIKVFDFPLQPKFY